MLFRRSVLPVFCLLLLSACSCIRPPNVRIVSPAAGEVINVGALVVADVPRDCAKPIDQLEFQYSRDGRTFVPIVGVAPYGVGDIVPNVRTATLWNAGDLPPGRYFLRAVARRGSRFRSGSAVPVEVNGQPAALFDATLMEDRRSPVVRLDGSRSSDSDGRVVRYTWDLDGVAAEGAVVTHRFQGPGRYGVSLVITDDRGGSTSLYEMLAIDQPPNEPFTLTTIDWHECGCEKMEVVNAGAIAGTVRFRLASSGIPAGDAADLGAYGEKDEILALPRAVSHRFQVIATLKAKSPPQQCAEGQRVKATTNIGGVAFGWYGAHSSDPRYHSGKSADDPYNLDETTDVPTVVEGRTWDECLSDTETRIRCCWASDNGPWCDDNYHGGGDEWGTGNDGLPPPNKYKEYDHAQHRILWLDAPGMKELSQEGLPYMAVMMFHATVSGLLGSCSCRWEVTISVDESGKVLQNEMSPPFCTSF